MNKDFLKIIEYNRSRGIYDSILCGRGNLVLPKTVVCINPHSIVTAENNEEFKNALISSELILPDGVGFCLTSRVLYSVKIPRVTGYDFFLKSLKELSCADFKFGFIGSTDETLKKIKERIIAEHGSCEVFTFSPPFVKFFTDEDIAEIVNFINNNQLQHVFLGLTAPKQEMLMKRLTELTNNVNYYCIGAVFDYYAGNIKRAPLIFRRFGLEWLFRSIRQPSRLGMRNVISNPIYLYKSFIEWVT